MTPTKGSGKKKKESIKSMRKSFLSGGKGAPNFSHLIEHFDPLKKNKKNKKSKDSSKGN